MARQLRIEYPGAAIKKGQRFADRPPLETLFRRHGPGRDRAIAEAVMKYGYSQKAVADFVGLHFTRVNHIVQKARRYRLKP